MTYDGERHTSLLAYPEIRDRLIVLNGWSKTWAMTGWRMGWSIWPDSLIDKVRKLAVNCWSCVNAPSQFAGIAAIDGPQDAVDDDDGGLRPPPHPRHRSAERLAECPACCRRARSTPSRIFPRPAGRPSRSPARCWRGRRGADRRAGFRGLGEGYIRVSCANSDDNIEQAVARIGQFLEDAKTRNG
jgi:aspartate aminotransferase